MCENDNFTDEQKKLFEKQIENLEEYIETCTQLLSDVDVTDIARVYDDWNRCDPFEDKKLPYKLSRRDVTQRAYEDCMEEMFRKSQPAGSYNEYIEKAQRGEITENDRVYEWHYLSQDEYKYILDKYIDAYGMRERWTDYVNTVINYFQENATKDKWIPERTDETGFKHPGYRSYEHLPHFVRVIEDIINKKGVNDKEDIDVIAEAIYDAIIKRIEWCRDFYRFDREESVFHMSVAMGPSPTCNKEHVIEYWKNKGVDLEIIDRDPKTFWEMDEYGEYDEDEDEPIDIDEDMEGEYVELPEDKTED